MTELVPLNQIDISEYVVPSKLYRTSDAIGEFIKVYYLTDLHLEHNIKSTDSIDEEIARIVNGLCKESIYSFESIIFIGGDVADSIQLSEKFYKQLRDKYPKVRIIAVLGNHEISEFATLEEAVTNYKSLFKRLRITFLHNSGGNINYEFYNFTQTISCVGGIGFAPFNETYNANNIVVSHDIQFNRKKEIAESKKFLKAYNTAIEKSAENKTRLLVFTHYPIGDWLPNVKVDARCIYFNGHIHSNDFYFKDNATIVADNQIGYNAKTIKFKCIPIGTLQNPFYYYPDGYHEITVSDYYAFYKFNGIGLSGEGKGISNRINSGSHFYMIKKNGFYMFLLLGGKTPLLCVGAQIKRVQGGSNIDYYYNAFDTMIKRYIQLYASMYKGMQFISKKVKKFGFSGRVHGFIVDIDFYNHIMVNPFDGKLTFYYSPTFGLVKEYPNVNSLVGGMKERVIPESFESKRDYNQAIKRLDRAISELKIGSNLPQIPESNTKTEVASIQKVNVGQNSMYDYSRRMYQIQRLFECNILRVWDPSLIENLYID